MEKLISSGISYESPEGEIKHGSEKSFGAIQAGSNKSIAIALRGSSESDYNASDEDDYDRKMPAEKTKATLYH
jgi:hypothetical protein